MDKIKQIKKNKFLKIFYIYIGSIIYAGSTFFVFAGLDILMWRIFIYALISCTLIVGFWLLVFYLFFPSIYKENTFIYINPLPINKEETGLDSINFWPVYNIFFGLYVIVFPLIVSLFTKVFYGVFIVNFILGISVIISQIIILKKNNNLGIIKEIFLLFLK